MEQVERGLKQAEVEGRRKAEEVQAVKNKVWFCFLLVDVSFLFFLLRGIFVFFVKQCNDRK